MLMTNEGLPNILSKLGRKKDCFKEIGHEDNLFVSQLRFQTALRWISADSFDGEDFLQIKFQARLGGI